MLEELGRDVSGEALERRFEHINPFGRLLSTVGTIVRIFLHVAREQQADVPRSDRATSGGPASARRATGSTARTGIASWKATKSSTTPPRDR